MVVGNHAQDAGGAGNTDHDEARAEIGQASPEERKVLMMDANEACGGRRGGRVSGEEAPVSLDAAAMKSATGRVAYQTVGPAVLHVRAGAAGQPLGADGEEARDRERLKI